MKLGNDNSSTLATVLHNLALTMEAPCKKSVKLTPSSSCVITNLPSPILMEILSRVPIRTLMASKCVCKSWLHLIQDPLFAQLHQARAPTEVCFQCFHYNNNTTKLHLGNFNFLSNFAPHDVKFNTLFEVPKFNVKPNNELHCNPIRGDIHFANSCNGLLCFGHNSFAVVCNPCTNEFITFPAPSMVKGLSNCRGYGFGFSTKANKYKLLRVMGQKDLTEGVFFGADLAEGAVAEICTIEEACSWKQVGPCPSDLWLSFEEPYATLLEGTLHWIGASDQFEDVTILTFDFEDDQFGSLPLPFGKTYDHSLWREELGVLAGCLSVTDFSTEGTVIWLMKEYGVQDSWTKLFCLGNIFNRGISHHHYLPIIYMDNGEVLMTYNLYGLCSSITPTIVFCYNPVQKSIRLIGSGPSHLRVITFRPSLVLLKDSMLGYKVHVKPRCADTTLAWWEPIMEKIPQHHGSNAPLRNDELLVPAMEEESQGHVNAMSELSASESSTTMLAHQQGT